MSKKKQDLNQILEEVVQDVTAILAKAEEKTLVKASPGEEAPGEETPAGSSAEGSEPEAPAPEASPAQDAPHGEQPAAEASSEGAPEAEGAPDGQDQDPAMDETSGPEALQAEYAKLPVEELKLHVMAAHAALMAAIGGDQGQPGEQPPMDQGQAPAQPGLPPEATPGTGPEATQQMGKAEKDAFEARLATLEKSLKDKDETIAQLEEKFGQAAEKITAFIEKRVGTPMRKSISGISYDAKPGTSVEEGFKPMSKSEAVKKLNDLTSGKDLKKSDRELVTKYVLGNADQSTVSHLLK